MKPVLHTLLLLSLIALGNPVVAQSRGGTLVEDVKRVSASPNTTASDVARLNSQLKEIYQEGDEFETIEALKHFQVGTLAQLIEQVAEQIDEQIRSGKFVRIAIPEFTAGSGQSYDPKYGGLPRYVAEFLRQALATKAQVHGKYTIFSEESIRNTFKNNNIVPSELGTEKTKNLRNQADGNEVSLLASGHLSFAGESGIALQVDLIDCAKSSKLEHQIGGKALLNTAEWAMTGLSAKFTASPPSPGRSAIYRVEPGLGLVSERQLISTVRIRGAMVEPHPLASPQNNNSTDGVFDVWIETRRANSRGRYAPLRQDRVRSNGNDQYVGLDKGEEFRIVFKAECSEDVFVRVLVDGLNTLSQPQKVVPSGTRGACVEAVPANSEGESIIAPRVSLEEARPWVVLKNTKSPLEVPGFFDVNDQSDTLRRFQVVDADDAVAAKKNYTEKIGLITVAFYKGKPGTSTPRTRAPVGTSMGNVENVELKRYEDDIVPGEMVAVYNIRYMTPEALRQMETAQSNVCPPCIVSR